MTKEIILTNDILNVTISTLGAELISVKRYGVERIWIGDKNFWSGHAPLLYPICGNLKENIYLINNVEYELKYHGYGRFIEFEVESQTSQRVVMYHRYNNDTLKVYPFKYELRVIYSICASSLKVEYNIKNLESTEMYFSIGSHEGLYCPEGIEEYSIVFEKPESLDCVVWEHGLMGYNTKNIGTNISEFQLKQKYFEKGALNFLNLKSKQFTLVNRKNDIKTVLKTDGKFSCFSLWSVPNSGFVCLEPWYGMPDFIDTDFDFKKKKGIIVLLGHEETTRMHEFMFR